MLFFIKRGFLVIRAHVFKETLETYLMLLIILENFLVIFYIRHFQATDEIRTHRQLLKTNSQSCQYICSRVS